MWGKIEIKNLKKNSLEDERLNFEPKNDKHLTKINVNILYIYSVKNWKIKEIIAYMLL